MNVAVTHWNFIDPINLWNYPFMRNIAADNRARSLKLNQRPRQTSGFNSCSIAPPQSEARKLEFERVQQVKKHMRMK